MRRSLGSVVIAVAVVAALSFTTLAFGQSDAARAIYASAANIPTNISGVHTYPAAPKGFNPVAATDEELAAYGFPPRPDKSVDAHHYAQWERAMQAAKHRYTGELKAKPFSSRELMLAKQQGQQAAESITAAPKQLLSLNWSGVANTNKLKTWNSQKSFQFVISVFNVPNAQPPLNACANGITGPFYEVSWNGIDGANNGDVLQGGSLSAADCAGDTLYEAWVEWFPSYSIIGTFFVNPGDDMFVETFDTAGGFNPGNVFVEDITTQAFGTFTLTYVTGPPLVGSSAEWIVERPCCNADGFPLALANTVYDFFDDSFAETGNSTVTFPGSTAATTEIFTMVDDGNTQNIEVVDGVGTSGFQGRYSLWFSDTGCAFSGGCTPK